VKDNVESTASVDGRLDRVSIAIPNDFEMPPGGLNIRRGDTFLAQEERLHEHKRAAVLAYYRANNLDKLVFPGGRKPRMGIISVGKNYLDVMQAMDMLGIDAERADALGLKILKLASPWPVDPERLKEFVSDIDLCMVVEEKRSLIEVQVREELYGSEHQPTVVGKKDEKGNWLFPVKGALDPNDIAIAIASRMIAMKPDADLEARLALIEKAQGRLGEVVDLATRTPYFCSGCPHNSSTKVPEGSRAYAGIGCHYMVQWMDRSTLGFTHMGGEGANWIGEAPFSTRGHVFQNLGDGTYNHSGVQAIRAALAAGTTITYKILFNDAVAMTGGQRNEGGLTAARIAHEITAMGVKPVVLVYDAKEDVDFAAFPPGIEKVERAGLMPVQERLAKTPGVSAILYVQTCAAEKRRRRKRGEFPDPDRRVFINSEVCEGCGDCGVQSNCVSIVPKETDLGRKRAIDQSSCNKDFSCLKGFCPSFVTLEGARVKKAASRALDLPDLPEPVLPAIRGTHNIVITGVGGTGVVTVGAVLAQAAQIDGLGAGMMEMAGLAQKGGAVHIHLRLANRPEDISAVRVAVGEAHCVIGGDLVVTAGAKTIGLMTQGQTGAVVNSHDIVTGAFTRDTEFRLPVNDLTIALQARLREGLRMFDASDLSRVLLGDSIYSNMMVLGGAWQAGLVPLSLGAIREAITLNKAAVEGNLRAFDIGRWAVLYPADAERLLHPEAVTALPADPVALREARLVAYQGPKLAARFRALVDSIADRALREAVAQGYYKLLAYKDEYEVARLHLASAEAVRAEFDGDFRMSFHLAPPILGGKGPDGRPKKREFGPWMLGVFKVLARMKGLRGTPFDPFGYAAERREERALIARFEGDMRDWLGQVTPATRDLVLELALLPLQIRGYGPVKAASVVKAEARRAQILAALGQGGTGGRLAAE